MLSISLDAGTLPELCGSTSCWLDKLDVVVGGGPGGCACVRIGSTGMAWHRMVWGGYVRQRHVRRLRRLTGLEVLITCSSDPEGGLILANCELRAASGKAGAFRLDGCCWLDACHFWSG
jgi:hypothetical protein